MTDDKHAETPGDDESTSLGLDTLVAAKLEETNAGGAALLASLRAALPDLLTERSASDTAFRRACRRRWKQGFDLLQMFIALSEELGSSYNDRGRPVAFNERNHRFEAIALLHARAVRVANEIQTLLHEGFPDGALSRWRTLHELAVTATFLARHDDEIARRFLAHRGVASAKALRQHEEYVPRSGMAPLAEGELARVEAVRDALVQEFGPEFVDELGWAFPVIGRKRANLHDLELATGLDHWRPRFRWASDDIHAGPKPPRASLGMVERPMDQTGLLVGRSDSGFTDPAHMCVLSLNLVNHALPPEYFGDRDLVLLSALRTLSDQVGETFLRIDRAKR